MSTDKATQKDQIYINPPGTVPIKNIYYNTEQEVIYTTEDRLRLCLITYIEKVTKKEAWLAPFGMLVTIIVTLVTSTFHDFGFAAETWQAIFVVLVLCSAVWLVYTLQYCKGKVTIDTIVNEMKNLNKDK